MDDLSEYSMPKKKVAIGMKCTICEREASKCGLCLLHSKAYEKILEKYESWRRALDTSWQEYLREIAKNPLTGEWDREMAEHLVKNGEQYNVKTS